MRGATLALLVLAALAGAVLGAARAATAPGLPLPRLACDAGFQDGAGRPQPAERVITADRLAALRRQLAAHGLDACIVPYSDEHQNEWVSEHNMRLRWLSGFSGPGGVAVVTRRTASAVRDHAVLWVDGRQVDLADEQLDCSWQLVRMRSPAQVADWLLDHLPAGARVGADSRLVLTDQWDKWYNRMFNEKSVELVEMDGLVDDVWRQGRPPKPRLPAFVHKIGQRGMLWQNRVREVQKILRQRRVDGLVLTALDEVAWLLNIRGRDLPHAPLLTAYVLVTLNYTNLYLDLEKVTPALEAHLKSTGCTVNRNCVKLKRYEDVWLDLAGPIPSSSSPAMLWLSNHPRLGASRAVLNAVRRGHTVRLAWSPVIAMKSVKNEVEREAMRAAHARDGAAMCELLSFLEDQIVTDAMWTESRVATRVDFFRRPQESFYMTAFPTHVGYGPHGALPHYVPRNSSDLFVGRESTVVIDSGGQYENGTTDVARTLHYGAPSRAHVEAYTRVLQGLVEMSRAAVPAAMGAHAAQGLDSLARAAVWEGGENYAHPSGHGIGAFLNVHEEPNIFYGENADQLQEGNFFTAEPGYYKKNDFGVRLENVLEVVEKKNKDDPGAAKFLEFRSATLVPFDMKLVDVEMLSPQQRHWLNEYNARVRSEVGEVLKAKQQMTAFYWMMNHTLHVPEHCCPRAAAGAPGTATLAILTVTALALFLNR